MKACRRYLMGCHAPFFRLFAISLFLCLPVCVFSAGQDTGKRVQAQVDKCLGPQKGDKCWERVELAAIREAAGEVQRDGGALVIATKMQRLVFRDKSESTREPTSHYYLGIYPEIGYHLVARWKYSEELDYLLISQSSGNITTTAGVPLASPSSNYVVSVLGSESSGLPNHVALWSVRPERVTEIYRYSPAEYFLPASERWVSDDEVAFSAFTYYHPEGQCKRPRWVAYRIRKQDAKWVLTVDPNAQMPECK